MFSIFGSKFLTVKAITNDINTLKAPIIDREILVFDESTSALDDKVESDIIDQIRLLKDEKTIILISHRNSTIKYCNKVYHIDRGSVKEL